MKTSVPLPGPGHAYANKFVIRDVAFAENGRQPRAVLVTVFRGAKSLVFHQQISGAGNMGDAPGVFPFSNCNRDIGLLANEPATGVAIFSPTDSVLETASCWIFCFRCGAGSQAGSVKILGQGRNWGRRACRLEKEPRRSHIQAAILSKAARRKSPPVRYALCHLEFQASTCR